MHGDPSLILLAAIAGIAISAATILETVIAFSRGKKLSRGAYCAAEPPRAAK